MNINTLSEHRCADKCTDFKATREQCNHCLVSCPEISDNSSYSKIPNSSNFVVGDAVVYLSAKKLDTIHYIRTVSTKFEYVVLDNADVVNFDSIRHATVAEFTNNRRLPQGVTFADVDLGDDAHIENHISPLCLSDSRKNESQSPLSIKQDALSRMESCYIEQKKHVERLQTEVTRLNSTVERLKAENKMLHEAAATHLKNQMHFKKLYDALVEQLYPYAIDLEEPVDGDVNITSQEFINGYNRARECAHYNLLEMMESDVEYIKAQCGMLGGEA